MNQIVAILEDAIEGFDKHLGRTTIQRILHGYKAHELQIVANEYIKFVTSLNENPHLASSELVTDYCYMRAMLEKQKRNIQISANYSEFGKKERLDVINTTLSVVINTSESTLSKYFPQSVNNTQPYSWRS